MKKQYVLIFHVYLLLNVMVSSIASVMIIFKESKLPLMQVLLPSLLIHYYSMKSKYPEHYASSLQVSELGPPTLINGEDIVRRAY